MKRKQKNKNEQYEVEIMLQLESIQKQLNNNNQTLENLTTTQKNNKEKINEIKEIEEILKKFQKLKTDIAFKSTSFVILFAFVTVKLIMKVDLPMYISLPIITTILTSFGIGENFKMLQKRMIKENPNIDFDNIDLYLERKMELSKEQIEIEKQIHKTKKENEKLTDKLATLTSYKTPREESVQEKQNNEQPKKLVKRRQKDDSKTKRNI